MTNALLSLKNASDKLKKVHKHSLPVSSVKGRVEMGSRVKKQEIFNADSPISKPKWGSLTYT